MCELGEKPVPFCSPMLDSSVLILNSTPSYRISLLEVKLIRLPMYESADGPDFVAPGAAAAMMLSPSPLTDKGSLNLAKEGVATEGWRQKAREERDE